MVIFPSLAFCAAVPAITEPAAQVQACGWANPPVPGEAAGMKERFRNLGSAEWDAIRTRYPHTP